MGIEVEVLYPPDEVGHDPMTWQWEAPGSSIIEALPQTFAEFQVIDEQSSHLTRHARSMMVGDLICFPSLGGRRFVVEPQGFTEL